MSIRLNSMKNIPYSQSSVRLPSSCHLGHLGHLSRHFMKSQSHLSFVFYIADWQTDWQTNNFRIYRSALQTIRNNEHFFWYSSLFSFDTKIYHIYKLCPTWLSSLPSCAPSLSLPPSILSYFSLPSLSFFCFHLSSSLHLFLPFLNSSIHAPLVYLNRNKNLKTM